MNSSAPGAKLRAMGRKSPEVQTDLALRGEGIFGPGADHSRGAGPPAQGSFRMTCQLLSQWVRARPQTREHQSAKAEPSRQ